MIQVPYSCTARYDVSSEMVQKLAHEVEQLETLLAEHRRKMDGIEEKMAAVPHRSAEQSAPMDGDQRKSPNSVNIDSNAGSGKGGALHGNEMQMALQEFVSKTLLVQPGETLVFTAMTKGFIRGVVNWLALLYRLNITSIFVLAMDAESHQWLSEHGFPAYRHVPETMTWAGKSNNKHKRITVWYERSGVILQLLQLGYNVIQSDGDALWLQNPLPELKSLPDHVDIAFSRGNARAGKAGRGTGVCMGFVSYRPTPGAKSFLRDVMGRMVVGNDVDQGIANALIGGSRGRNRDRDPVNASLWYGQYKNTSWVHLPQTRYTRHAGRQLNKVADHVNLHVFHPADEGWTLPFKFLPQILPDSLSERPTNRSREVKEVCRSGRWFERMGYSEKDQRILRCCGFWMLKDSWNTAPPLPAGTPFVNWLEQNSYMAEARRLLSSNVDLANDIPTGTTDN